MCLGDGLPSIGSVSLSRLALGAIAALLSQAAAATQSLPSIVHPAAIDIASSPFSPFGDIVSTVPGGAGQRVVIAGGAQEDFFGWSVAIDGDTALVGAYGTTVDGHEQQGAAYVFTKADGVWNLSATLTASDGTAFDIFGERVALSGNVAAIGAYQADDAKGAVYVFTGSGSHWTQKARLVADDGAANDCLGWSLAVTGQHVLAGAPFVVTGNAETGAIYSFAPSGGTWAQTQKLVPDDSNSGDEFGSTVAADGTTAVVAADGALVGANYGQGAAYVYSLSRDTWTQQAKLIADDGVTDDNFGRSVAVSGSTVLVGAPYVTIDGNGFEGAVYVFGGSDWQQQQKLVASDGAADGFFGWSVAVSGSDAIVGEPFANVDANYAQGAAFFYELAAPADDTIFANGFE